MELKTESKMFCPCSAQHFNVPPNSHTCPVCLGLPGALPFPNKEAIERTILMGLALNCQISYISKFDRKNYFYPDLPKGYQISQYDLPLAKEGRWAESESQKQVRIKRVHLEEDTGKLTHTGGSSLIDYNRSGVPLMEIVTEPDFQTSADVKYFLQRLQQLVRYLGVADADMEKGAMRCEPNVNLKIIEGDKAYYTPIVEIKNVNSFRYVQQAIEYEIERQYQEFTSHKIEKKSGNKQTRGWNESKKVTIPQREKEEAEDYRYFPEPDIPPLHFTSEWIEQLRKRLPELPFTKKERFIQQYQLAPEAAEVLTETLGKADYYEEVVEKAKGQSLGSKEIANLIINKRIEVRNLSPNEFIKEALSRRSSFETSEEEATKMVEEVLRTNTAAIEDYKKGKVTALEFLVGQVARVSKGKVDPNLARQLLANRLQNS